MMFLLAVAVAVLAVAVVVLWWDHLTLARNHNTLVTDLVRLRGKHNQLAGIVAAAGWSRK